MSLRSHYAVSDIFNLENIVQQIGVVQGKNLLIDMLRELFKEKSDKNNTEYDV